MNMQRGFLPLLLIAIVAIAAGAAVYFNASKFPTVTIPGVWPPKSGSTACTEEAKQCPDGSYVGRSGPKCEFAVCPDEKSPYDGTPGAYAECTSDAQCPANSVCEGVEGIGTVSPGEGDESTFRITKGYCKLKTGNACTMNADCGEGICYAGVCTQPIDRQCAGPHDTTCGGGYECVQSCGPPVIREEEPEPPYFCQLKGYQRVCPICLASETRIATPEGDVRVTDLRPGMKVWSQDTSGTRIPSTVIRVSRTPVPATHLMLRLSFDDSRTLLVSPGHPTTDGRTIADLSVGENYDGSRIIRKEYLRYEDDATYDLLPDSPTGYYWANGIVVGSTLK